MSTDAEMIYIRRLLDAQVRLQWTTQWPNYTATAITNVASDIPLGTVYASTPAVPAGFPVSGSGLGPRRVPDNYVRFTTLELAVTNPAGGVGQITWLLQRGAVNFQPITPWTTSTINFNAAGTQGGVSALLDIPYQYIPGLGTSGYVTLTLYTDVGTCDVLPYLFWHSNSEPTPIPITGI